MPVLFARLNLLLALHSGCFQLVLLYCSGLLYSVNLVDLSRTNFVVYSELLLTLTSLLQFNRFFVVHLWSGLFCSTVSLCCVLDALSLKALSAFAELDFELQYSVTCSTLGSG